MAFRNTWALAALIVVLLLLIIFMPSFGWRLRNVLSPAATSSADPNVAAENEMLESQLAQYKVVASQLPTASAADIRAMVYSRYPFNLKNELLVNAGSEQGVQAGAAVTFQGILIGRVIGVYQDSATVQTIFDPGLEMPVRIGSSGSDGLLLGGPDPSVGSIEKGANIMRGDIVYSAASGLPYGLPVGEISATSTSADSLFQVGTLNFAYDLNDVETVLIGK